jgi:NAD(P)-dependent dehydrogenase (short-subunit alcohol dehydrogenase family)
MGLKGHAAYVASKHAVIGLTKTCARDHGSQGIRVNAIAPGVVETAMMSEIRETGAAPDGPEKMVEAFVPQGRVGEPEEVARLYAWLLGDESSFVNGSVYVIDGGWISGY